MHPANPSFSGNSGRHERGIALVLVLWVVTLLAVIAGSCLPGIRFPLPGRVRLPMQASIAACTNSSSRRAMARAGRPTAACTASAWTKARLVWSCATKQPGSISIPRAMNCSRDCCYPPAWKKKRPIRCSMPFWIGGTMTNLSAHRGRNAINTKRWDCRTSQPMLHFNRFPNCKRSSGSPPTCTAYRLFAAAWHQQHHCAARGPAGLAERDRRERGQLSCRTRGDAGNGVVASEFPAGCRFRSRRHSPSV